MAQQNITATGVTIPTATNRNLTVTTSAAVLAPANPSRSGFFVVNDLAGNVWINFGGTAAASAGAGNIKIPPGGRYEMPIVVDIRAISIIGEVSGNITAMEYV